MKLTDIIENRYAGSLELAKLSSKLIEDEIVAGNIDNVKKIIDQLVENFPLMAIFHKMREMISPVNIDNFRTFTNLINDESYLDDFEEYFSSSKSIMTFSNSTAVFQLCKKFANKIDFVFSPQSRPGGEGIILGEKLQDIGLSVELIEDLEAAIKMPEIDYFIFGCDLISNGFVINKTGTLQLCLLAQHYSVPILCICPPCKRLDNKSTFDFTNNHLFEKIPIEIIKNL